MKALLDMPVSALLLNILKAHGHEGVHAYELGKSTASDSELLSIARQEGRIVITADLDFPRLLALSMAEGPGLILFRGSNYSDFEMSQLLNKVLQQVSVDVLETSICVVNRKRIRVTRLPITRES